MVLRSANGDMVPRRKIDLQELALELRDILGDDRLTLFIFGSRKDKTGSIRSDVDLLVQLPKRASREQMEAVWRLEPYLDVFALDRGVAESFVNESQLRGRSNSALLEKVGAVCLMRNGSWLSEADSFRWQTVLAERNPAATMMPMYDLEDAIPAERADLLVVTALTKEYQAVLAALGVDATESFARTTQIDGKGSPWDIRVLNLHEMGSVGAALKVADAMRRSKPSHVVLVGICGGVPNRAELCDVVVPQAVIYYEPGKITPEGTRGGFDSRHCDEGARRRISELSCAIDDVNILADGELIACGEKVIADKSARDDLCNQHRKLAAIDMESYGVVRAAEMRRTPVTVIKSVCDVADASKSDGVHDKACAKAARVLVLAVRSGAFRAVK